MLSPAAAVVDLCGIPGNFALKRAFLKFQASSCQTLDAFVDLMHSHMEEDCYSTYNGSDMELLFLDHMGKLNLPAESLFHRIRATCDPVWSVQEEGGICVSSRMTTVMIIIRERECKLNIPRAQLSRKGTAKLTSCYKKSSSEEWCVVLVS